MICVVPRQVAPHIAADADARNAGGMVIFTAGFAETREPLGIQLQERIVRSRRSQACRSSGRTAWVCTTAAWACASGRTSVEAGGNVSYITQSGSRHGRDSPRSRRRSASSVTRTVSIGNAVVVNEADYLEFLGNDPDTQYIGMYLEGVKDGRRFFATCARS